jgi:hypothetical protein
MSQKDAPPEDAHSDNQGETTRPSTQQWLAKAHTLQTSETRAARAGNQQNANTTPAQSDAAKQFLAKARATQDSASTGMSQHARLIFAMDATASRQPTWARAMQWQAEMFKATDALGGLNVQLCYFRGFSEFSASPWLQAAEALESKMRLVSCLGGYTQIEKVLRHALSLNAQQPIRALVFVGDAVEEDVDLLCHLAGELGDAQLPIYIFQEGNDPFAQQAFMQMARLSKGAHLQLGAESRQALAALLGAVAAWAAGGSQGLSTYVAERRAAGEGGLLLEQLSHTLLEDLDSKSP